MRNTDDLKGLQLKMDTILDNARKDVAEIRDLTQGLFKKIMGSKENLQTIGAMITALENSRELTSVENDDLLHSWTRVDFSKLIDESDEFQKNLLERYFSDEYGYDVDFKNDVLSQNIGPVIFVNPDGDVYDQDLGKIIISKHDYESDEELNAMIETHMERTGHFPSVVNVDHHDNYFYRNTQALKQAK